MTSPDLILDYDTRTDPRLQQQFEQIESELRTRHSMDSSRTAAGLLDLKGSRLAMIHPDRQEYGASLPKIGILLAYFHLHPEAAWDLHPDTRRDLGKMIKTSDDQAATRIARSLGLKQIQEVLNACRFYNPERGGGLWMGKFYGETTERRGDPLANHSHAATVRQLLRFYLLLEQRKLVSPAASNLMLDIFASEELPADEIKFVKGLAGRGLRILRKWGTWEDWRHDSAIITGPDRHYILAALTHHPAGDEYLADLAAAVDHLLLTGSRPPVSTRFEPAPPRSG